MIIHVTVQELAERADTSVAKARAFVRKLEEERKAVVHGTRETGKAGRPPKVYRLDDSAVRALRGEQAE